MDPLDPSNLDAALPAFLCARRCKVSRQLFHSWVKRGLIAPVDTAADGRALYRVRDALAVEIQTLASGRSTRARTDLDALHAELCE